MPYHSRFAVVARVVLLPLGLSAAVVLGLGSYTETSDDHTLAWLFAGTLALKPVASLPLYFHGYGHALAAAYAAAPGVPWLGLLLAVLLAGATVLFFAVLDKLLRPYLRPWALAAVLAAFFGGAWLEHWLWFSHVRVGLLLGGAAVLFAAQRPGRRYARWLGLAGVGAAWLIRPSLAVLAVGAVLPAALLLASRWRRAAPLLLSLALGLALASGLAAWQRTPAEARTQARDRQLARILDYDQRRPAPQTAADSLGTAAVAEWLLGDSAAVNTAFLQRAYRFDAADFWSQTVPAKLRLRAGLLVRDYFPLLLALALVGWGAARQPGRPLGFWVVQVGFVGGLLVLAGILKLPPRLALPLLDFWLLTSLAYSLPPLGTGGRAPDALGAPARLVPLSLRARAVGAAVAVGVLGLYGAKVGHRRQVLRHERSQHDSALQALRRLGAGPVRVLAGTNDVLKSLSPFRVYSPGPGPVLLLTGWNAYDASQAALRQAVGGSPDQMECLRRLAARPGPGAAAVRWVLTPETAAWLCRRAAFDGTPLRLFPERPLLPSAAKSSAWLYRAELQQQKSDGLQRQNLE